MLKNRRRKKWSLLTRTWLGLVLLFIPMLILASIYYLHMKHEILFEHKENLISQNDQLYHSVLAPYINTLEENFERIYKRVDYRDLAGANILHKQQYQRDWQVYLNLMGLNNIYFANEQSHYLIYPAPPESTLINYNPTVRSWYTLASENPDHVVWTEPYMNYGSNELIVTLARAVLAPGNKQVGVLAIDTKLQPLDKVLNSSHMRVEHGYQMLLSAQGVILAHPDKSLIFKDMQEIDWLSKIQGDSGIFEDHRTQQLIAYHQHDPKYGILLTILPTINIHKIFARVSSNIMLVVGVTSICYLIVALIGYRYFRRMVNEIVHHIRASRDGLASSPSELIPELMPVYGELSATTSEFNHIRQQTLLDPLTGVYNRRFFDELLHAQLGKQQPLYLVMFDLDNFKTVNDTYGHQVGDVVLFKVCKLAQSLFYEYGWFCRYGGEEFVMIFNINDRNKIHLLLEEFRQGVALFEWREKGLISTVSVGVAYKKEEESGDTLLEKADAALYRAKCEGKNRVIFDG
ncbi:diguanylate cyclase [Psychromonas sp. MME2]|uniref:sensor domain-containing diguanylate cyclase n=1 Tax=unclassified Psychromonas TaxID=2614957 RepID=UPI00339BF7F4